MMALRHTLLWSVNVVRNDYRVKYLARLYRHQTRSQMFLQVAEKRSRGSQYKAETGKKERSRARLYS